MANLHNSKTYQKGKIDMKKVLSKSQVVGFKPNTINDYDTPSFNGVSDEVRDFLLIMCIIGRPTTNSETFLLMQKYLNKHLGFNLVSKQNFKDLKTMRRFVWDSEQFERKE
jgi:hypothetical protein